MKPVNYRSKSEGKAYILAPPKVSEPLQARCFGLILREPGPQSLAGRGLFRVGFVWRFKRSDVEAYLEARRYGRDRRQDG